MRKLLSKEEVKKIVEGKPEAVEAEEVVAGLLQKGYSLDGFELVVVKSKGQDGKQGLPGQRGAEGARGPQGLPGVKGDTGSQGPAGRDGRDGRDGTDGKDGRDGLDGSPDTGEEIIAKINASEEMIDASRIANLPQPVQQIIQSGGGGFIETPIVAGSNITVTKNAFGNWVISSTASGGVGTPTSPTAGTVDGSTVDFTFTTKPTLIVSDGATYRENFGWTWSGSTATLSVPPVYDLFAL